MCDWPSSIIAIYMYVYLNCVHCRALVRKQGLSAVATTVEAGVNTHCEASFVSTQRLYIYIYAYAYMYIHVYI